MDWLRNFFDLIKIFGKDPDKNYSALIIELLIMFALILAAFVFWEKIYSEFVKNGNSESQILILVYVFATLIIILGVGLLSVYLLLKFWKNKKDSAIISNIE
jgi:predicted membrane protein